MSTTSCPRCSAQVTLPVGVSNDATVRCPLCHAHYTLADALVNMPPLLEVVGEDEESLAADWLAAPEADGPKAALLADDEPLADDELEAIALPEAEEEDDAPLATALPFDEMNEEASEAETLELGSLELGSLELESAELGSVELEDDLDRGTETVAEDLGFSTIESPAAPEPLAALPADDDDEDLLGDDLLGKDSRGDDPLTDFGGDELTAGPAEEDDLPLEFGEELSAEAAGAETMEFSAESLAGFSESDAGDLKFDLDANSNDLEGDDDGGATLDFGATLDEKSELKDAFGSEQEEELAFDAFDAEGETVQFNAEATGFGGEEDLKFDDPLASEAPEGDELRGFEDLRFEPSDDAGDAPDLVPVAPVMAATPAEAVEEPKGKKGKKEKKKKEKKVKVVAEGDPSGKRKRSLVGILVGALIAIPAALYGALWLGRDYDIVGLSNYLPAMALPAEYSKKTVVAQTYVPPAALPADNAAPTDDSATVSDEPSADAPAEEVPAEAAAPAEELPAGDESTAHTTARPPSEDAATDDPAASADAMANEAPSLAEPAADAAPAEAMPAEETPAAPADDDLFAPSTDAPAADAPATDSAVGQPAAPTEDDPFGAATDTPTADAPAADAPAEADPFGPATDAPATSADAPADDLFAPTPDAPTDTPAADAPATDAPAEAMPAEETPAAPAEDDLFSPSTDAPATDAPADASVAPAEDDPFGAATDAPPADAPAEAPAEMSAEDDVFAPSPEPAADPAAPTTDAPSADTTRPAEPDPFAPEPVTPAEEMPAAEDPVDPLTDAPAPAEDVLTPAAPAEMPDAPPADDPLSIPAEPATPEPTVPEPATPELPAEAPATPALPTPQPSGERVGPRNVAQVSPQALSGAMQSTFVANQQLIAAEAAADEAALRKARAAFYVNLFGMADAITSAQQGPGAAELDPSLQQLASVLKQQLAADPRRLESLKVFGARWIGFPKRTTDGVVVSGTVESVGQVGQLYHTKARLGSGADAPLVTIVSATDPQLASGDTVLALGSIVERPAEEIAGYQGDEPSVVWSGMALKVPN